MPHKFENSAASDKAIKKEVQVSLSSGLVHLGS